MDASALHLTRVTPSGAAASPVAALLTFECDHDTPRVAIPRPEVHLVVRFGPSAQRGVDVHAFGAGQTVRRKVIRRGQQAVMARLHLGAAEGVLGVSASAIAGRVVALEELWGDAVTEALRDRLGAACGMEAAARILDGAIRERLGKRAEPRARPQLALDAADRLNGASVNAVAVALGVSERHLRRVFREAVGVSPKAFARLTRFHHALRAARADGGESWASIAAGAGYYDQAHLIAEFHAIAGVTPRALLGELGGRARGTPRGRVAPVVSSTRPRHVVCSTA